MTLKKSLGFPGLVSLPETDAHTRPPPFLRRAALLLLGLGGSCSPRPQPLPAPAPRRGDTGVGLGSVSHTPVLLPSLCPGGSATVPRPENPRLPGQLRPRCLPPVPSGAPPSGRGPSACPWALPLGPADRNAQWPGAPTWHLCSGSGFSWATRGRSRLWARSEQLRVPTPDCCAQAMASLHASGRAPATAVGVPSAAPSMFLRLSLRRLWLPLQMSGRCLPRCLTIRRGRVRCPAPAGLPCCTPAAPHGLLSLCPGGGPLEGPPRSAPGARGLSPRRTTLALKPGKDGRGFRRKSHGSGSSPRSGGELRGPRSRGGGPILHPTQCARGCRAPAPGFAVGGSG